MAHTVKAPQPHTQGGGECWCGYAGMKLFQNAKRTATRAEQEYDKKGLYR